jgi:hypothetical protein
MSKALRLPLKTKWFEMTKSGVKSEDYREMTPYWSKRLCEPCFYYEADFWEEVIIDGEIIEATYKFKPFETNIMTLGYPKSNNLERIMKLEHKGIEIRTGNPEWGAEPDKLYFVIKHGAILS